MVDFDKLLCRVIMALVSFAVTLSAGAQISEQGIDQRIEGLRSITGDSEGARECISILMSLRDSNIQPEVLARGLDRLRDACSERIAWTNSILAEIASEAVSRWRPLEVVNPAGLCRALQKLGKLYHYLTRVGEAEALYREAIGIARRKLGKGTTSEDLAAALETLSGLEYNLLRFPEALRDVEESLRLRRKAVPYRAEKVVASLGSRARIEMEFDRSRAKGTLLEARKLSLRLTPEFSYDKTRIASNLGEIYFLLGELPEALSVLQEAERERLRERILGRSIPQLAATQLLLGQVFVDLGDYPKALDYYRKAEAGHLEWLGQDPYRYCDALSGLASVLEESGDLRGALVKQREALLIRERAAVETSDPELQRMLATSLTRLGALQERISDSGALVSLERALQVEDSRLAGRANDTRAQTLLALARHWERAGNRSVARAYADRGLHELTVLNETGPALYEAQETIARLADEPAIGLVALKSAVSLALKFYGRGSPRFGEALLTRASLLLRQGDIRGALRDALTAQRLSLRQVGAVVQVFARDQALTFAADRRRSLDLALDLLTKSGAPAASTTSEVWQVAAESRMVVRDAEISRQRVLLAMNDKRLSAAAQRLISARERFAYLLVQSFGSVSSQSVRLGKAQDALNEAEEAFASRTGKGVALGSRKSATMEGLRRNLPIAGAMVGFFRYYSEGEQSYLAFILTRSRPICFVKLGRGDAVDLLVSRWRESILGSRAGGEERRRVGVALRQAIWDPIAPLLGSSRRILLVPDGALHLVSFAALPAQGTRYLLEDGFAFHVVPSERELDAGSRAQRLGPWLAVGGVNYQGSLPVSRAGAERKVSVRRDVKCKMKSIPYFPPLPGSIDEVHDVVGLWTRLSGKKKQARSAPITLEGEDATEQAFRYSVRGYGIVHLATHGFVKDTKCRRGGMRNLGIGGLSFDEEPVLDEQQYFSGLALAGANKFRQARQGDEDGILTETEILGLDLSSADWVILSACNSGLGSFRPGEGIVGLVRAFQVAGAKTVIQSLWSVEDQAARLWMQKLYEARFKSDLSTLDAVQKASVECLRVYRRMGDDNPARWAAFVANGHWH